MAEVPEYLTNSGITLFWVREENPPFYNFSFYSCENEHNLDYDRGQTI